MRRISPPLRQQRLGRKLRELRAGARLTLEEAGVQLGWSRAKVSRIETGHSRPTPDDLALALTLYGADEPTRDECMQLARQAGARPWWRPYRSVLGAYVAVETEARLMRYWQPQLVPGLLQTEAYARTVIAEHFPWEDEGFVELRVRARMARQWLLRADDPVFVKAVIAEEALRRPIGGAEVMSAQLHHLLAVADWGTVEVRVLPRTVGAHAGLTTGFLLLSPPDAPVTLFQEGVSDDLVVQPEVVREYEMRFAAISAAALPPEESMDLMAQIAGDFSC